MKWALRIAALLALLFWVALQLEADLPGDERLPRCEPRGLSDPARLNVDSDVEDFGLSAPCDGALELYIAQKTEVETLRGQLRVARGDAAEERAERPLDVSLGPPDGGLRRARVPLQDAEHSCEDLRVELRLARCHDAAGAEQPCPPVRVKTTMGFGDLDASGAGIALDVCYDD